MKNRYSVRKFEKKEENSLQLKGSLTVESALVLPLFFLAIAALIGIMDLYGISARIQTSLCESAEELGMYAYCRKEDEESPVGIVDKAVCTAYGTQKMRTALKEERMSGIVGGANGIVLKDSVYEDGMIRLKAVFLYKSPVALFQVLPVKIQICGQARAWSGYAGNHYGEDKTEELVYITDWESVYHTSETCSHLDLSVHRVSAGNIENRKNEYGESYKPCDKCVDEDRKTAFVYITDMGNHYHESGSCGGLTRHVRAVKISEVQNLQPCSRCGGG